MSRLTKFLVASAVSILILGVQSSVQGENNSKVYQLIVSTVELGHMAEYSAIIEKEILPMLKKHDVELVGAFNSGVGGASNELTLILGYKDYAHIQQVFQDACLQKIQREKFASIRVLRSKLLIPTAYSPLK